MVFYINKIKFNIKIIELKINKITEIKQFLIKNDLISYILIIFLNFL